MEIYHVVLLAEQNRMLLSQTFTTYSDALNYIHGKDRVHPIDAYVIVLGKSVQR